MARKRIIPVIMLKNGTVVQSKRFMRHQILGTPSVIVGRLSNWFADEVIYLDISREMGYDLNRDDLNFVNRDNILDIIEDVSRCCFMPLTVGGGIRTVKDVEDRLGCGADKVSINTQALSKPEFIRECASIFGSQCITVSMDAKKFGDGCWEIFKAFGKDPTGISPRDHAMAMEDFGAGEILLNSIDNDGQGRGYDLELVKSVVDSVSIPVIALGGVGNWKHFSDCIDASNPSAVAASNIFQYSENSVYSANEYLFQNSYDVRRPALENMIRTGEV